MYELADGGEHAAAQPLLGEGAEEALDEVEPGSACRREVTVRVHLELLELMGAKEPIMKTNRTLNTDRSPLAAAVAAVLVTLAATGEPAQAQRSEDPREYARLLATEMRGPRDVIYISRIGCPADGAWEREAFEELYRMAEESDFETQRSILGAVGRSLRPGRCPEVEPWLREQLEKVYSDYKDEADSYNVTLMWNLTSTMSWAKEQASHDLVREIAMDADVGEFYRRIAAETMVAQRFGGPPSWDEMQRNPATRKRWFDAQRAVLFELAVAPPLPEFELSLRIDLRRFLESQGRDVEAFNREYRERLIATGRIPPR